MKPGQQQGIDSKVLYDINQRIDTVIRALTMVDGQTKEMLRIMMVDMQRISMFLNFVLDEIKGRIGAEEMDRRLDAFAKVFDEEQKRIQQQINDQLKSDKIKDLEEKRIIT